MIEVSLNFLVVFAILWILMFVLNKVFFGPLWKIRERRRAVRDGDRDAARKALETYDRTIERLEQSLKAARLESEALRENLGAEALREKARLLDELNAEYRRNVDKA